MFKITCKVKHLLLGIGLYVLFSNQLSTASAEADIVKLSKDGGYHMVIAVSDETGVIPLDMLKYLKNVQERIQEFSEHLFVATHGRFHVRKLDLVIPWSWTIEVPSVPESPGISFAVTQSYETADIRLFERHTTAHVENPNACGFTGQYIELPLSFFDNEIHATYGPTWKAVINQWARYRWGVWEEHGEPGNADIPYFYRKPNGTSWLVTGCSDSPIIGNVTNESGEECDLTSDEAPGSDCRLRPNNDENTAKSSLMHFHWLDTVTQFCDYDTHDSESPNRQNKYCKFRSVWEVVERSLDYRRVTQPAVVVPRIEFTLMVQSRRPLLYLLIDQGRNNIAEYVLDEVFGNLTKLFDQHVEQQVVASIGTYPAKMGIPSCHVINDKVHWKLIRFHRQDFAESLQDILTEIKHRQVSNPPIRNFGEAILEVVRDINARGSPSGGILLVLKTGAGENTFDRLTPEADVLTALAEKQNIIVHAIEMPNTEAKPYTSNLKRLVEKTGGRHAVVSKSYHISEKMIPLIDDINEYLSRPTIYTQAETYRQQIFYDGELQPNNQISFPIHTEDLTSLQFYFTLPTAIDASKIVLTSSAHPSEQMRFDSSHDWNEKEDYRRRTLYTFSTSRAIESSQTWTMRYECTGTVAECRGDLIVYGFLPLYSEVNDEIDVVVSTSAPENLVDMSFYTEPTFVAAPFSIFAKVTRNRQPIRNVAVEATIEYLGPDGTQSKSSPSSWKITLVDDGFATPDIVRNDGIYSGVFIPDRDGYYKIHVTAETTKLSATPEEEHVSISNLLPVNQQHIGCLPDQPDCKSVLVRKPFRTVVSLENAVYFINTKTYVKGRPFPITDLEVIANSNFYITFEFTTPRLIGMEGGASQFNFYMSPRLKTLIGTGQGNSEIMINIGDVPGKKMSIRIPALEEVTAYYAVEALNGLELRSGSSNIFGVKTRLIGDDPTTTTGAPPTQTPVPTPTPTQSTTTPSTTVELSPTLTPTSTVATSSSTQAPGPTMRTTAMIPSPTTAVPDPESTPTTESAAVSPNYSLSILWLLIALFSSLYNFLL